MNYRHAYHAGNFADVMKHAILTLVIAALQRKPKPFRVIDTHAGRGIYDLSGDEALRTQEAAAGIIQLQELVQKGEFPAHALALLQPYLSAVSSFSPDGGTRWYPGSVSLARELLRRDDRLVAGELHPEEAEHLKTQIGRDRRVNVLVQDAWVTLKAVLPPPERRGVILIDPPFERPGEFGRLVDGLMSATKRFATGIYLLWYPMKDVQAVEEFLSGIAETGLPRLLNVQLHVRRPGPGRHATGALYGSGLIVHNPPFGLADDLQHLMPALASALAQDPAAARCNVVEMAGER